jgi:hypothetical protein
MLGASEMSSTPPTPDEGPAPEFPGFKMGMGAPEYAVPPQAPAEPEALPPFAAPRSGLPLVAIGVALAVVIAVVVLLLLT